MGGWVGGWVKEPLDHLHLSFIQSAQTTHPTPHQIPICLPRLLFPTLERPKKAISVWVGE